MPYTLIAPGQPNGNYTVSSSPANVPGTIMERDSTGSFAAQNGTFGQVLTNTTNEAVSPSQTSNANVSLLYKTWQGNATSAAFTLTLLPSNTIEGTSQKFVKTDSSSNHILLACQGSDSIVSNSGLVASYALTTQGQVQTLTPLGSNLYALG
jgi:hypothetical protein